MMRALLSCFLSCLIVLVNAQPPVQEIPLKLSDQSKIHLVTCGPGSEVWSHFGHTAIRVEDPVQGLDLVFNYGMFDYMAPNFMMRFAKREIEYYLDVTSSRAFMHQYKVSQRYVYQQELRLSTIGKQLLYQSLYEDYTIPEKRSYLYEFFFDNCATRPRDLIFDVCKAEDSNFNWTIHPDNETYTFRELIDKGFAETPWVDFGIDLVLGSRIDEKVTNHHLMFLPDYLSKIIAETMVNGEVLGGPIVYLPGFKKGVISQESSPITPSVVFWILALIILIISVVWSKSKFMIIMDSTFFFVFGLLGVLLLFMWFGTAHPGTKVNYNLIWATPIHLVSVAFLCSHKLRQKFNFYFLLMAGLMFLFVLTFWFLPQSFHPGIKPIVVILAFRYFSLHKIHQSKTLFK